MGHARHRPLCFQTLKSNNPLLCLEARPSQSGNRRNATRLELQNSVCLSPLLSSKEGAPQTTVVSRNSTHSHCHFEPHREWFLGLVVATIASPKCLPPPLDLLSQPHVRTFHHCLNALCLTTWRLSRASSAVTALLHVLRCSWRRLTDLPLL